MGSLSMTRWLLGYVRFTVVGGNPERFMNYCARSHINLWDIRAGANFGACVSAQNYRMLRPCARKADSKLKVGERHGLSFATKGVRKHRGIVIGTVLFFAIVYLLSLHVWSIEVSGNTTISTEKIEAELTQMGFSPGTLKSKVEPHLLQQKLMLKFPQIGWMTVNTRGCTAEVKLQEKIDPPPMAEQEAPKICNVKASQTGQILSLTVYAGTAQVKEGDAVVAGQILINSVVKDDLGNVTLKHAAGKIIAATSRILTTEVELKRKVSISSGEVVTRRSLNLFNARVPLTFNEKPKGNYKMDGVLTDIKLMNAILPIGIYEEKWTEQKVIDVTLTKEQALEEAKKLMEEKQKTELKDAKITSVSLAEKITNDQFIYTALVKCEENVAQESEIVIK